MVPLYIRVVYCVTWEQMPNSRASWSDEMTRALLEICIDQKKQFNWNTMWPSRPGWVNIYQLAKERGIQYEQKQVHSKVSSLKMTYKNWVKLQTSTGLGRDKETGGVSAPDSHWEDT